MNYTPLKGVVRYDGTDFAGWQMQHHARTVQGGIESAMARIARQRVPVQGAGRTDAGVHALGQVFSCAWPGTPPKTLRHALSRMLAPEVRITALDVAAPDFNARFSAHSKRYCYTFDLGREPDPLAARYAWHVPFAVDLEQVAALLPLLQGEHDFKSFQSTGSQIKSTVRNLYSLELWRGPVAGPRGNPDLWHLAFHGDGFLYKMVRNITGTLIEIGRGRLPASFLAEALAAPGVFRGHCAPAHGLFLMAVYYDAGAAFEAGPPAAGGEARSRA